MQSIPNIKQVILNGFPLLGDDVTERDTLCVALLHQLGQSRFDKAAEIFRRPEDGAFVPRHVHHDVHAFLQDKFCSHHFPFEQDVEQCFKQFQAGASASDRYC